MVVTPFTYGSYHVSKPWRLEKESLEYLVLDLCLCSGDYQKALQAVGHNHIRRNSPIMHRYHYHEIVTQVASYLSTKLLSNVPYDLRIRIKLCFVVGYWLLLNLSVVTTDIVSTTSSSQSMHSIERPAGTPSGDFRQPHDRSTPRERLFLGAC